LRYLLKGLSFAIILFAPSLVGAKNDHPRISPQNSRTIVTVPAKQHITHATWYAGPCIGRTLADGKRYDQAAVFVATHEPYPFGTKLRVTNLHNHRSIVVSVEDREPYHPGRSLDLSLAAARQLDIVSVGVVLVSYSKLPPFPRRGSPQ